MTNLTKNYTPEVMPKIEIEGSSAQIFLAFYITWENKEYNGTLIATLSNDLWIEDYEIEWANEEPDFGEFESYMYEKLEEMLLEEVLKEYNVR